MNRKLQINDYGHSKETKIAAPRVKKRKIYLKLLKLSSGKARKSNRGKISRVKWE